MKYKIGQEIPIKLNSITPNNDSVRLIETKVVIENIIDDLIFIMIPLEYGAYKKLLGTERQLDKLLEARQF